MSDNYVPTPGPEPKWSNMVCCTCGAGPFEGPRALAKHEGRMHRPDNMHIDTLAPIALQALNDKTRPRYDKYELILDDIVEINTVLVRLQRDIMELRKNNGDK